MGTHAITLRDEQVSVDYQEAEVDVSHRFDYAVDPNVRTTVPGRQVSLHLPFDGEANLLQCRPSSYTFNPPRAQIARGEIVITSTTVHGDASRVRADLDEEFKRVREWVQWVDNDVRQHNQSLEAVARESVQARRTRLLEDQDLVSALGYPLRRRSDMPDTYAVPARRRAVSAASPRASAKPFLPEPALDEGTYEEILKILANMVCVMEQSPGPFAGMKEEDLRTHFLVQLNAQFEAQASAETFRGSGSTDILSTGEG